MILICIWAVVAVYFCLLWLAVGLEMAIAGSVFFWAIAARLSFPIIAAMIRDRASIRQSHSGQMPGVANLNRKPGR